MWQRAAATNGRRAERLAIDDLARDTICLLGRNLTCFRQLSHKKLESVLGASSRGRR
jgi:hypothetical protein